MLDLTRAVLTVAGAALALAAAGCDGGTREGSPTATPRPSAPTSPVARTPPLPFPPPPVTSTTIASPSATPTSTPPPPSTPGTPGTPTATATPAPTVPPGRVEQMAPIEGFEVRSGTGGTAIARITSGLPSGCAVYSRAAVSRTGTIVKVEVYNHLPTGQVACTAIYGMVTNEVSLGAGFTSGVAYTIDVNGMRQSFTPR